MLSNEAPLQRALHLVNSLSLWLKRLQRHGLLLSRCLQLCANKTKRAATKSLATSSPVKMRSISYAVSCATCSRCGKQSSSGGMSDGSSFIPADPSVRGARFNGRCPAYMCVCVFKYMFIYTCTCHTVDLFLHKQKVGGCTALEAKRSRVRALDARRFQIHSSMAEAPRTQNRDGKWQRTNKTQSKSKWGRGGVMV